MADRTVIRNINADSKCISPEGLQNIIDELMNKYPKGRAFVRPSGTEDVVRVYAESSKPETTDCLAYEVAVAVYEKAGGIGPKPSKPSQDHL